MRAVRFIEIHKTAGSQWYSLWKEVAMSKAIPKAPEGLGKAGRELWTSVLRDYWMDGESHKLAILEQAAKVCDRIAEQEAAMKGEQLTVRGSKYQPVIHPLVAEARAQRGLLASLLKSLQLPEGEDDEAEQQRAAQTRSERARYAARCRWDKAIR